MLLYHINFCIFTYSAVFISRVLHLVIVLPQSFLLWLFCLSLNLLLILYLLSGSSTNRSFDWFLLRISLSLSFELVFYLVICQHTISPFSGLLLHNSFLFLNNRQLRYRFITLRTLNCCCNFCDCFILTSNKLSVLNSV